MPPRLIDEVLARDACEAPLGFHALTGCGQTGEVLWTLKAKLLANIPLFSALYYQGFPEFRSRPW